MSHYSFRHFTSCAPAYKCENFIWCFAVCVDNEGKRHLSRLVDPSSGRWNVEYTKIREPAMIISRNLQYERCRGRDRV